MGEELPSYTSLVLGEPSIGSRAQGFGFRVYRAVVLFRDLWGLTLELSGLGFREECLRPHVGNGGMDLNLAY